MRFRLVEAERARHPVSLLCTVLGVTSAGYYAWRRRGRSLRSLGDAELKRLIVSVCDGSLQTYGRRASTPSSPTSTPSASAASGLRG
jgi:putative transposase